MKNFNEQFVRSNAIGTVAAANDPIDCFLNSLGADLRQLSEMERLLAIHEMRQAMYKYEFASLQRKSVIACQSPPTFESQVPVQFQELFKTVTLQSPPPLQSSTSTAVSSLPNTFRQVAGPFLGDVLQLPSQNSQ